MSVVQIMQCYRLCHSVSGLRFDFSLSAQAFDFIFICSQLIAFFSQHAHSLFNSGQGINSVATGNDILDVVM